MEFVLFILFSTCSILISGNSLDRLPQYREKLSFLNRIQHGQDADVAQAPFMCSFQWKKEHICGCAILSSKWIITAGHCLKFFPREELRLLVGTHDLKTSTGTYFDIESLVIHDKFNDPPYAFDIGLIKVNGSIEFNDRVRPIQFSRNEIIPGKVLQLTGWGWLTPFMQSTPDILQSINLVSITNEECRNRFAHKFSDLADNVHDSHMCVFDKNGGGSCKGDSGGPLVLNENGVNTLVGLTSFGLPCSMGYPGAFTKISYFYDWIESHIEI